MTKLRITNNTAGSRGVYINGELIFIGAGKTSTFSKATDKEIADASGNKDFRVQSGEEGSWEELSSVDAAEQRPFLVIATDSAGGNYRRIDLNEGEWFVGFAIASDAPDTPEGYSYIKIGGADEVADTPVTLDTDSHQTGFEVNNEGSTGELKIPPTPTGDFDPVVYLDQNGNTVIASIKDKPPEVLESLLEAEKANKNRKGVVAAIEELLTEPETESEPAQEIND